MEDQCLMNVTVNTDREGAPRIIRNEGSITIVGTPNETKNEFFDLLKQESQIVDGRTFREMFPNTYIAAFSKVTVFSDGPAKKTTEGIKVYLNKDDFIIAGKDYSDLIPIILRHEIAELWYFSKTGFSMSPPPKAIGKKGRRDFAHALALREEYGYAFKLGKADRLLEFMTNHHKLIVSSETSLLENVETYLLLKQRNQ